MGQNFDQAKCDDTFWPLPNILKGSVHVLLGTAGLSNFELGFRKTKDNGIQYLAYLENKKLKPYSSHCSALLLPCSILKNPGKTAVLVVLLLVAALNPIHSGILERWNSQKSLQCSRIPQCIYKASVANKTLFSSLEVENWKPIYTYPVCLDLMPLLGWKKMQSVIGKYIVFAVVFALARNYWITCTLDDLLCLYQGC